MKVLVTGGAGYIGSVCVEELIKAGHKVAVFDSLEEGHQAAVDPAAPFIAGDLNDRDAIFKAVDDIQPDAVMHFAAYALVGESMTNPSKYFTNNVGGTVNLLDAMVAADVKKLVFSSTCATYGVPERMPMDESLPQNPINPYGESKLLVERILRWYAEIHGVVYTALRYFNAAGATARCGEDRKIETHLVPIILQVAAGKRDRISIFGDSFNTPDGTCIRDYIHVVDLASAHIAALDATESDFYNLGTGDGYSVREVIEVARKVTGHPIPEVIADARPGDPPRLVASADKAKAGLGWKLEHSGLENIVRTAWEWVQAHPNGYQR